MKHALFSISISSPISSALSLSPPLIPSSHTQLRTLDQSHLISSGQCHLSYPIQSYHALNPSHIRCSLQPTKQSIAPTKGLNRALEKKELSPLPSFLSEAFGRSNFRIEETKTLRRNLSASEVHKFRTNRKKGNKTSREVFSR